MKRTIEILIISILLLCLSGCSDKQENTNSRNENIDNSISINRMNTNISTNSTTNEIRQGVFDNTSVETELATFSTQLSGNDNPRSRNIQITASTLNGTTVEPNSTFSFCNTIGVCTVEKGYEKADTFDHDGNKIQTLGGGNCQVSSTLYNVVLQIPELQVIERHPHSKRVYYVPIDKDAAVAHGSVDFKFKNTFSSPIKIYAQADLKGVTVRIVKTE